MKSMKVSFHCFRTCNKNTKTFLASTEEFKETGKNFSGDREAEIGCWVVFFVGGGFVLYCFMFFTSYVCMSLLPM